MKYLSVFILLSFFNFANAADRSHALLISQQIDTYVVKSQSPNPDRAVAYRSNRDDVDDTEVWDVVLDTSTYAVDQIVRIQRDSKDSNLDAGTTCDADYGTVTINSTEIVVQTIQLPVRVRCASSTGQHTVSWKTYLN